MKAHSSRENPRLRSVLALVVVAAAGCSTTPVSLRLAPELAGIAPSPVSGERDETAVRGAIAFDRWSAAATMNSNPDPAAMQVDIHDEGANEEVGVDIERTAFFFDLRSNGAPPSNTAAQCVAEGRFATHTAYHGRITDETTITLPGYPRIDCAFTGAQEGHLAVRPEFVTQRDFGSAQFGQRLWEIRSVNNLESQRTNFPLARFGYELLAGGRVVAAVETWGAGRVWIAPGLQPQEEEELSVVMTALLYYGSLLDVDED